MDAEFWHGRWHDKQIGFNQPEVNRFLEAYWPGLNIRKASSSHNETSKVLVPLCGKSIDMRWFAERGYSVLGVELSEIAAREFFEEWGCDPVVTSQDMFTSFASNGVEILVGDFFALTADAFVNVGSIYDRAAMVALPPQMRKRYTELLTNLVGVGTKQMLITFSYDQTEMDGPPFSVTGDEIETCFSQRCDIRTLTADRYTLRDDIDSEIQVRELVYR